MKKILLSVCLAGFAMGAWAQATTYENGMYVLCEGNYGSDPGFLNFYSPASSEMQYDLVTKVNPDYTLGKTAQFAASNDEVIYITSKQNIGEEGPRIAVFNAHTLELIKAYDEFPEVGGDGRGVAISDMGRGYAFVASNQGIVMLDAATGDFISSTSVNVDSPHGGIGDLLCVGPYVYVASENALLIYQFNGHGLTIIKSVDMPNITTVFKTSNGNVYAGVNSQTWGTPTTYSTEQFIPISGTVVGEPINVPMASMNTWFAVQPTQPAAAKDENAIFYAPASLENFICKYNFDTGAYTQEFITLPQDHYVYAHSLNVDPATGDLIVATFNSYGSTDYWTDTFDSKTGVLKNSVKWDDSYYWFPCYIFPAPSSLTGVTDVASKQVSKVTYVNLAGVESATPFSGINIKVTHYVDGTTTSSKVVK